MPIKAPKIDERTYETLVKDLEKLVQAYSGWRPSLNGNIDVGGTVIRVFSQMTETVLERLNKVPQKNFLAFLDLIGTHILPPGPARVPLTFLLAEGTTTDALVSARTQVGATLLEGEEEEVNFETAEDLVVTPAQLKAVFVRLPGADNFEDNTAKAAGTSDDVFAAFEAQQSMDHSLFLANDQLLTLPGLKSGKVTFYTPEGDAARLELLGLNWFYWDGMDWQDLPMTADAATSTAWSLHFQNPPLFQEKEIEHVIAKWLKARLRRSLPPQSVQQQDLQIEYGFAGTTQLNLEEPFVPFEKSGDFFYLYLEPTLADVPDDFVKSGGMIYSLEFFASQNKAPANAALLWEFSKEGTGWKRLGESNQSSISTGEQVFQFADNTKAFTQSGKVNFELPEDKPVRSLNGQVGRWLRVKLSVGTYKPLINSVSAAYKWQLPNIEKTEIAVEAEAVSDDLTPDLALLNSRELDLSKDFYPFGERPVFNDTFFIKSNQAFATPGSSVTMDVSLSDFAVGTNASKPVFKNGAVIVWEAYNGSKWQEFGRSTAATTTAAASVSGITDSSQAFTKNGEIIFSVPDNIAETTLRGETGYWIRARIIGGDYGGDASYDFAKNQPIAATLSPPSIKSMTLAYTHAIAAPPEACFKCHDFRYLDVTDMVNDDALAVEPFTPTEDVRPALYLGFDQKFSNRPMTLYSGVEPPLPGEIAGAVGTILQSEAKVVWEYHSPEGWANLGAMDETNTFGERGLIKFIGPPDFTSHSQFGQDLYWLRARWDSGEFRVRPRLRHLLTNTMWANHAGTIRNEMLGSGNGNPNQTFNTLRFPVLPGVRLEIREPELPSAEELARIKLSEGEDALSTVLDESGQPEEIWVRWQEVQDFYGSGSQDRHYLLNHLTGQVRFGDGQNGMVPPLDRSNIRIAFYQAGGGARGNRATGAVIALKTTIPYVDSVANYESASGGSEKESLDRVQERGPKTLRHRDRAVTDDDIEDLAYEASSDVARALAITPYFDPNDVQWLPLYVIEPNDAGDIAVEITSSDEGAGDLQIGIYGPGQGIPYAQNKALALSYTITKDQFDAGGIWRVEVRNLGEKRASGGTLKIIYPGGATGTSSLDVPTNAEMELAGAGKIELVIVPNSSAELPTPTLNLINQVEDYILSRCSPTIQLWVTDLIGWK